jgi:hypothetical protein
VSGEMRNNEMNYQFGHYSEQNGSDQKGDEKKQANPTPPNDVSHA